jgi:hypothetical protein
MRNCFGEFVMKSAKRTPARKSLEAVFAFVDSEIAKIVQTVVAERDAKRTPPKPRRPHPTRHAA